jgi:tetratricopeptide (TPR) repeat protein
MSGQALERLFVGRDALMKEVLKRITVSATRKEKHFILLVGPRGMGKTHFVSLAYHKLKTDPAYANVRARLKIAYLNEEEWGVASFLDLLVRILRALVSEHGDPELSAGINRIYETFKQSPEAALQFAESLLIQHVQGSTLLLICENLSDLFEGLDVEGQQRWRAFIQEHPFWTILATTPALFSGVKLQTSPFYNFFNLKPLDRLDFDTATELLRQKALMEGRTGLADFLVTPTGRARVRAIHHLAGGNHRVYVILSDFLDEESLEELVGPFMRMADDLTPYYQDRMRQLAPQQRKIIELLCQESRPLIVKDIATRALISQQVAAKQLGELAKLQFVVSTKVGRESYYELAEPLMRICVDIKDNRTEHFRLFVEFLRHWFTGRELRAKLDLLKQAVPEERHIDRLHLAVALQEFERDSREPFLEHLDAEAWRCFESDDYQGLADALPRLLNERPTAEYYGLLVNALTALERFEAVLKFATEGAARYPNESALHMRGAYALTRLGRHEEALDFVVRALKILPSDSLLVSEYAVLLGKAGHYELAIEQARRALQLNPKNAHAMTIVGLGMYDLGRYTEAEQAYRSAFELNPDAPLAFSGMLLSSYRQEKFAEVVALADSGPKELLQDGPSIRAYGESLFRMGRFEDALEQFDRALKLENDDAFAHALKAATLVEIGRQKEAVDSCVIALRLNPSEGFVSVVLEVLLSSGNPSEVLSQIAHFEAQGKAVTPFWQPRAHALLMLSRYREAHELLESVRQNHPQDLDAVLLDVGALAGSAGFGSAMAALDSALAGHADAVSQRALSTLVSNVLSIEYQLRGAVAMARQVPQLRIVLDKHQRDGLMPAVLSKLLDKWLERNELEDAEWSKALSLLESGLADRPDCRIALEMLSVAVRYQQSRDKSVLLELPLEQRTLLLEKMGVDVDAAPSA